MILFRYSDLGKTIESVQSFYGDYMVGRKPDIKSFYFSWLVG